MDGEVVGRDEGDVVGEKVGTDGTGFLVGAVVGDSVGSKLGEVVGRDDGEVVGASVGCVVVGSIVGNG